MHFCLYVIHNESESPEEMIHPFCEGSEEYYAFDYDSDDCFPIGEIDPAEAEADGMVLDDTGEFYGYRRNLNATYDWYSIGGRWNNMLPLKDGTSSNEAKLKDIDIANLMPPADYVTPDGEWIDNFMLFMQPAEQHQITAFREYAKTLDPETVITVIDCHF